MTVLNWLENTSYAEWANESWGWPLALTIHAFGTAMVVGLTFIIGLRLFGLYGTIPYTSMNKLVPFIWFAAACQIISGVTLWITKPGQYLADGMIEIKFTLDIIALVDTRYFQMTMKREAADWETNEAV